jgi:hypothetical protein
MIPEKNKAVLTHKEWDGGRSCYTGAIKVKEGSYWVNLYVGSDGVLTLYLSPKSGIVPGTKEERKKAAMLKKQLTPGNWR